MDHALDQGINFLDTAELYSIPPRAETQGSTERIIGSWLKARGNRDRVIVASKAAGRTAMDWFRGGRPAKLDRDRHHLRRRGEPEAAADRLYRPLPARTGRTAR